MNPDRILDQIVLDTRDPEQIRRRFLRAAMDAWQAPLGGHYTVRADASGAVRQSHTLYYGTPEFEAFGHEVEGTTFADMDVQAEDAVPTTLTPYQDHQLPERMVDLTWRPFGIRSVITISTVNQGRFAGNFNVFRTEDHPRFTIEDASRPGWAEAIHRMQILVDALFVAGSARDAVVRLAHPDGTMWMTSEPKAPAPPWLASVVHEAVRTGTSELHIGSSSISVTPLSDGERQAYLVVERPMAAVRFGVFMELPRHYRQAAAYAVHGATVPEIADAMNRSHETIKSWLKASYAKLGVTNRIELSDRFREAIHPAPQVD